MVSLADLLEIANAPQSMTIDQAEALYALLEAEQPDLVLELGRANGNSTCVFTAYANAHRCRVVSVGFETGWKTHTEPVLRERFGDAWLQPLTVIDGDIRKQPYAVLLDGAVRPVVFWDAHGRRVARAVLKRLVPLLPPSSTVVVHDVAPLDTAPGAPHVAGPFASTFPEVKPLWRFLDRSNIDWRIGEGFVAFTL